MNLSSLRDRGMVYAIAHVRGGDEMGWHGMKTASFKKKKHFHRLH